jgi:hypothetical protein
MEKENGGKFLLCYCTLVYHCTECYCTLMYNCTDCGTVHECTIVQNVLLYIDVELYK